MRTRHAVIGVLTAAAAAGGIIASTKSHVSVISLVPETSVFENQAKAGPEYIYPLVSGAIDYEVSAHPEQTICNSNWSTKSTRPPVSYTNFIKVEALANYNRKFGTSYKMADGELDHLVSIELGGSPTSTDNLWFEPYITQVGGTQVGAHEKDKVENFLHSYVCAGNTSLSQAQQSIVKDWYKIYLLIPSK